MLGIGLSGKRVGIPQIALFPDFTALCSTAAPSSTTILTGRDGSILIKVHQQSLLLSPAFDPAGVEVPQSVYFRDQSRCITPVLFAWPSSIFSCGAINLITPGRKIGIFR